GDAGERASGGVFQDATVVDEVGNDVGCGRYHCALLGRGCQECETQEQNQGHTRTKSAFHGFSSTRDKQRSLPGAEKFSSWAIVCGNEKTFRSSRPLGRKVESGIRTMVVCGGLQSAQSVSFRNLKRRWPQ